MHDVRLFFLDVSGIYTECMLYFSPFSVEKMNTSLLDDKSPFLMSLSQVGFRSAVPQWLDRHSFSVAVNESKLFSVRGHDRL